VQFGIQFFPEVGPQDKAPNEYFRDCLTIAEASEPLGYTHVRIVEHHFNHYGGYSPNPIVFLAAASQRTRRTRLVTGAIIAAFNHPLKVAAEIAMLDAICDGRLDVGFARAFLPHEFRRFGVSPDESVARYREAIEQIDLLLREENVTHHGRFHDIVETTTFPRPTQRPRPKFYVAASFTPDTFEFAGREGHSLMSIPMAAAKLKELNQAYRRAWREAGHPGKGEVMFAFHLFVDEDGERARRIARPHVDAYFRSLLAASSDWASVKSDDYKDYDKKLERMKQQTMETLIENGGALIGTPEEIVRTLRRLDDEIGFEHASLQVNFHTLPMEEAMRSMRLFADKVMPHFAKAPVLT
jgi:alkanesulfonate monooxygenase SsuD/methylene tetrahydromethanopterin reductase-like flavin-dependent oxidoreductase (luciferase family)